MVAIGAAASAAALAACGEASEPERPTGGGKLELLLREPLTLDPALASESNE